MSEREPFRVSLVRTEEGTTTCCDAFTTVYYDDNEGEGGTEYCKGCGNDIIGYFQSELLTRR